MGIEVEHGSGRALADGGSVGKYNSIEGVWTHRVCSSNLGALEGNGLIDKLCLTALGCL